MALLLGARVCVLRKGAVVPWAASSAVHCRAHVLRVCLGSSGLLRGQCSGSASVVPDARGGSPALAWGGGPADCVAGRSSVSIKPRALFQTGVGLRWSLGLCHGQRASRGPPESLLSNSRTLPTQGCRGQRPSDRALPVGGTCSFLVLKCCVSMSVSEGDAPSLSCRMHP